MARLVDRRLFYKKSFYLDLKHFRNEAELMKDIKRFGGKIESFLSKDVNYVISDRPEVKSKIEAWHPETPSSNASLPSPMGLYKSPFGHMHSPAASSPLHECGRGAITSRGLALIQKAKQKSEGRCDVLGICNQWKIKVVHIQVVLHWINKYKSISAKKEFEHKKAVVQEAKPEVTKHKLTTPFVKTEDKKRQFRTYYKELKPRDTVFTSDLSQVFKKLRDDLYSGKLHVADPVSSVLQEVNSPCGRQSPINVSFKPVIHKNFSTSGALKKQFSSKMGLVNDAKENAKEMVQHPGQKSCKRSSVSAKQEKKNAKHKYCEICQLNYQDLDTHTLSQAHQKFMNDPRNFQELETIVSTMPSLESFMWKVAEERKKNSLSQLRSEPIVKDSEHCARSMGDCAGIPKLKCTEYFLKCEEDIIDIAKITESVPENYAGLSHKDDTTPSSRKANIGEGRHCELLPIPLLKLNLDESHAAVEEYVSASCSTDDSYILPYLQDSVDKLSFKKTRAEKKDSGHFKNLMKMTLGSSKSFDNVTNNCLDQKCMAKMQIVQKELGETCHSYEHNAIIHDLSVKTANSCSAALDLSIPSPYLSPEFCYVHDAKRKASDSFEVKEKYLKLDHNASTMKRLSPGFDDKNLSGQNIKKKIQNEIMIKVADNTNKAPSLNFPFLMQEASTGFCSVLNSEICEDVGYPYVTSSSVPAGFIHGADYDKDSHLKIACPAKKLSLCNNQTIARDAEIDVSLENCHNAMGLESSVSHATNLCVNECRSKYTYQPQNSQNVVELDVCATDLNCTPYANSLVFPRDETSHLSCTGKGHNAVTQCTCLETMDMEELEAGNQNSFAVDLSVPKSCRPHKDNECEVKLDTTELPVLKENVLNCDSCKIPKTDRRILEPNFVKNSNQFVNGEKGIACAITEQNNTYSAGTCYSKEDLASKNVALKPGEIGLFTGMPLILTKPCDCGVSSDSSCVEFKIKDVEKVNGYNTVSLNQSFSNREMDCIITVDGKESDAFLQLKGVGGTEMSRMDLSFAQSDLLESVDFQKAVKPRQSDCTDVLCSQKLDVTLDAGLYKNSISQSCALNLGVYNCMSVPLQAASENAEAVKWVRECSISDSEPEWENLKSNVDNLCQELESHASDFAVDTEFPKKLVVV